MTEVRDPVGVPAEPGPEIAQLESIRRIELFAWIYLVSGAFLALWRGGWEPALVLTLAAAAAIVSLRGLTGLVRRLEPTGEGGIPGGSVALYVFRWVLLVTALAVAALLGTEHLFALVLGVTAVPAGVLAEAAWLLLRLARGETPS